MTKILTTILLLSSIISFGQESTKIIVSVPEKTDEVFIVGNQESLGNWEPNKVKMNKISDYEREITLNLTFPAEFKFTRGSWETEGYINNFFEDKPNIVLESNQPVNFGVKSWKDRQQKKGYFKYDFEIKHQYSEILGEDRAIAIKIPNNYNPNQKYSVIYVLDAHDLLNPFLVTTELLSKQKIGDGIDYGQDNIPQVILVGVIHNNRGKDVAPLETYDNGENFSLLSKTSNQFKNYLFDELLPQINSSYSTSGYNVIVGHSNSGHFVLNLPLFKENPFNGIIALSVNGDYNKGYSSLVEEYLKDTDLPIFLGYGTLDTGFNELAQELEEKKKVKKLLNPNLKIQSFEGTHNQVPTLASSASLKFMFNDYKNFTNFISESKKNDFTVKNYIDNYIVKNKNYGINIEVTGSDLYSLADMACQKLDEELFRKIVAFSDNSSDKIANHLIFYSAKQIGDHKLADERLKILEESNDINDIFTVFVNFNSSYKDYFLNVKKDPKKALEFLETFIGKSNEYKLGFSYFYAKIGIENNFELKKSKAYLKYCEKNYRDNPFFTKQDIENLKK